MTHTIACTLLFLSKGAFAREDAEPKSVQERGVRPIRYRERTEIEFAEVELQGEWGRPQVPWIHRRPMMGHPPLVWRRTDWDDEMKASPAEIR